METEASQMKNLLTFSMFLKRMVTIWSRRCLMKWMKIMMDK